MEYYAALQDHAFKNPQGYWKMLTVKFEIKK